MHARTFLRARRTARIAIVVFSLIFALVASQAAFAAKGGGRAKATITLSSDSARTAADDLRYGSDANFTVDASGIRDLWSVWVTTRCWQDGSLVYRHSAGVDYPPDSKVGSAGPFTMSGDMWPGGDADCTAVVWVYPDNATYVASTSYHVSAA